MTRRCHKYFAHLNPYPILFINVQHSSLRLLRRYLPQPIPRATPVAFLYASPCVSLELLLLQIVYELVLPDTLLQSIMFSRRSRDLLRAR
jgi:hypothetical protein